MEIEWDEGAVQRKLCQPSPEEIKALVVALDGTDRSLVMVFRDGAHMAVGGSAVTGLVLYATFDNRTFWQLVGDSNHGGVVGVMAGGQLGEYRARYLVDVVKALAAVTRFTHDGALAPDMVWEES
ncbi:MAG: hypothetical protein LBK95_01725 [Bifidobacteriaceae bacterium]|nr:hypothetical protein [Bifidobacteriaceae bacterium]